MSLLEHRVALILGQDSGRLIAELATDRHVWARRSPENEAAAHAIWSASPEGGLDSGVTLFNAGPSVERNVLGVLPEVELHHGAYSHDPPLSVLEISADEGFVAFRESPRGFHHRDGGQPSTLYAGIPPPCPTQPSYSDPAPARLRMLRSDSGGAS